MSFPGITGNAFIDPTTSRYYVEDDKYFEDTPADPGIMYETDGGLTVSRRRFTRLSSRDITTGFTMITPAAKAAFDAFFQSQGGSANLWSYAHPVTNEALTVRFTGPYKTKYTGIGITEMWDITDIKLRTV